MTAPNPLLNEIVAFLKRSDVDLTETEFGLKVMNDGKFVGDLRRGRKVLTETADKVRAFIKAYGYEPGATPEERFPPVTPHRAAS